ncbi:hypothetical protein C8A00DRAFT_32256 [Chaetomidium leptoderma]|uniref:Uncharacterized protein n=1 Tax=Chaetomidium leptoderma TaxID=669021 RepID=A0AAN6VQ90_9PEZI|nr:hypothetical protein C8A00DRAFT_32256 [Chaetomidium leptoderma]
MEASIRAATHDTALAAFHTADFSSFLSHLTDAVSAAWPDRLGARYKKVKVLLLSWDQDDLDVEPQVRNLESVFGGLYHYDTEYWKIPSRRSAVELSRKVADLADAHGQEGNLLILYYGGHARPSDQAGGSPVWAANRNRNSPTVHSSILHSLLSDVDCDVLMLHDCGHNTIQAGEAYTGNGVIETLAAGGLESTPVEGSGHSFTASLIQELAHAAHTTDWLSAVELHRRLINQLQAWSPTVSFANDTYSLVQVDRHTGQPMFERPRRQTPIHSFLAKKPKTIFLTPLAPQTRKQSEVSVTLLNPPTARSEANPDGPGILVTCRLRDQRVDVEQWRQWLHRAPEGAKNIQISALYPGLSAVLVLELPLVVWDLLPSSPAVSFVAYTTGRNHISEFRTALLGLDPDDPDTFENESGEEEEPKRTSNRNRESNLKGRRSSKRSQEICSTSSLWPKLFESDRAALYAVEDAPHCLHLAEMRASEDDSMSKAAKIIRAFTQDADSPATRYISDEIEDFCIPASFEALSTGEEVAPDLVAILDERLSPGSHPAMSGMRLLSHGQLYEALASRSVPQLISTELKADHLSPRRRLIYITNLDPAGTLALASTASETQAQALKGFVYKHLSFQSGMDVKLNSSGSQGFQLSFHLPFSAWRQHRTPSFDTRHGGDNQPLRSTKDVSFLDRLQGGQSRTYIHEAQISVMIAGLDNRHWTAYGFFDTYHDGGADSQRDVRVFQSSQGRPDTDPLTGGRHAADSPVWDAREYFLRAMEPCVAEVKEEWQNVGRQVLKALKTRDSNPHQIQRISHQAIPVLEQLTQGLAGTISAWERFKTSDLPYFDLDNNNNNTPSSQPRAMVIKTIENAMQELAALESSLHHQTKTLQSLTSTLQTQKTTQITSRTNTLLLTTTALALLPLTLAAAGALLVNAAPPLTTTTTSSSATRYFIASVVLAGVSAVVFVFVVLVFVNVNWNWNWAAARERVRGAFKWGQRGGGEGVPQQKELMVGDGKVKNGGWQKPTWWLEVRGKGYKTLPEEGRRGRGEEGDDEVDDRGRGLPF